MIAPDAVFQHKAVLEKLKIDTNHIEVIPYERSMAPLVSGRIDAHLTYRTGLALAFEEKSIPLDFMWVDDYGVRVYADTSSPLIINELAHVVITPFFIIVHILHKSQGDCHVQRHLPDCKTGN